jgi:hypothetical protein
MSRRRSRSRFAFGGQPERAGDARRPVHSSESERIILFSRAGQLSATDTDTGTDNCLRSGRACQSITIETYRPDDDQTFYNILPDIRYSGQNKSVR